MNKYLDRLTKQENEKKSQDRATPLLTKLPKAPFVSNVSKDTGVNRKKIITTSAETRGSLQQEEELRHLVYLVGSDQNFRQEDFQEAIEVALTDPVEALICFRSLARRAGLL